MPNIFSKSVCLPLRSGRTLFLCLLLFVFFLFPFSSLKAQVTTYTTAGNGTYTVPAGVTSIKVEVWGGGGRGGSRTSNGYGGGGGGGAYSQSVITVIPGQIINYNVGAGSSSGSASGGDSWFVTDATIMAKGGGSVADNTTSGASGGQAANGVGTVKYSGGNGANAGTYGGGGGSSAGTAANGNSTTSSAGATAPSGGGNGGGGMTGSQGSGTGGSSPGGGGGGAYRTSGSRAGGAGAPGQIRITVLISSPTNSDFWLKADAGTNTTTQGAGITTWTGQASTTNNGTSPASSGTGYTASTAHPTYNTALWNFNPGVSFSNGYFRINRSNIQGDITLYTIYSSTQNTSNGSWWLLPAIIGGEANGTNNDFALGLNAGKLYFKGINVDTQSAHVTTTSTQNDGAPKIVTATRTKGATANNYIFVNGTQAGTNTSDDNSLTDPIYLGIGRNPTETTSQFVGYISEAIGKDYLSSTTERDITETYLAVKYGVTLAHDYKRAHATDSVIYAISGYGYDVAGLGRMNTFSLHQKVSSSVNVASGSSRIVMATSNNFMLPNQDASRTVLTDEQYLVWGHNNGATSSWSDISGTTYKKITRVWRSHNTGNVGAVYFQIDLSGYPALPSAYRYAVLTASDASFTAGQSYSLLQNSSGTLYTTQLSFPAGSNYFTIAAVPNFWMGAATSTDWNIVSNWTAGVVPTPTEDVVFATAANNNGSPALNDLHVPTGIANAKMINNLTNASARNLIVPADASLTVNGVVSIKDPSSGSNSTDPAKIQIKTGATAPNGTFILNCAAQSASTQPDIYATIDLYARGYKGAFQNWQDNIVGSPTNGQTFSTSYHWQYFGVPVASVKAEPTFNGAALREYFENYNGDNTTYYKKWKDLTNESVLTAFKGYEITQNNPTYYAIAGKLVYCDKNLIMTRQAPQVGTQGAGNDYYGLGQNLFGNSFTAAIKVNEITFPAEAEQVVYLYNTGRFTDWGNANSTNNGSGLTAGQYTAIPKNASPAVYDGQIPSMNGFLVKFLPAYTVPSVDDKTLTVKYNGGGVTPNTKPQTTPPAPLSYLQIGLQSQSTMDNLWLLSQAGTTASFDNGWDGRKYFGTPSAFIFAETTAGPMQVAANETIDGTVINFYANQDKDYQLRLVKHKLQQYEQLHLIDLQSRVAVPLASDTTLYHFTANIAEQSTSRFLLVNSSNFEQGNNDVKQLAAQLTNDGKLLLTNYTGKKGEMALYDTTGRELLRGELPISMSAREVQLLPGVYLLRLRAGSEQLTVKLLSRNSDITSFNSK